MTKTYDRVIYARYFEDRAERYYSGEPYVHPYVASLYTNSKFVKTYLFNTMDDLIQLAKDKHCYVVYFDLLDNDGYMTRSYDLLGIA